MCWGINKNICSDMFMSVRGGIWQTKLARMTAIATEYEDYIQYTILLFSNISHSNEPFRVSFIPHLLFCFRFLYLINLCLEPKWSHNLGLIVLPRNVLSWNWTLNWVIKGHFLYPLVYSNFFIKSMINLQRPSDENYWNTAGSTEALELTEYWWGDLLCK